jgi:hypothetical protein
MDIKTTDTTDSSAIKTTIKAILVTTLQLLQEPLLVH